MEEQKCNKLPVARQFYIHQDVVNWFKQSLDEIYGNGTLTYKDHHHFNVEHVRFIEVCGDDEIIMGAVETIENLLQQTQYRLPWVNENLYYVQSKEQMQSVVEKLEAKHVNNYKVSNSSEHTEAWFRLKHLQVFSFEKLSKTKRRLVDRFFKQIAETNIEPILSIFNTLSFHEARGPPIKMAADIIQALKDVYLKYLSIEDILSLELANKDHRLPLFHTGLDHDIQTHLENRISFHDITLHFKEFKIPAILSYFIYKYRTHIKSSVIIPSLLPVGDIRVIAQLFGICTVNNLLTKRCVLMNEDKVLIPSDILNKYLSPVDGCHIYHNFNDVKYQNKLIRNMIVLRKRKGCTAIVLNEIFKNLRDFLRSQMHFAVDLHLIELDINYLDDDSLSQLRSFHNIIIQEMLLDIGMLSRLFRIMTGKISLFNCNIAASEMKMFDLIDTHEIRVSKIMFKHMNFEVQQLLMILANCATTTVLFDDCNIEPVNEGINTTCYKSINMAYIEFKYMKFTPNLLTILKHFGGDFVICFNDCGITNTDIWNIYTKTTICANRIKIIADHYVNELIVFELYIEYHKRNGVFELNERDFDIPAEIIPQVELLASKFNWAAIKLRAAQINDHTIKVDLVNNDGKVVDLFVEQNGLDETELGYDVNYY